MVDVGNQNLDITWRGGRSTLHFPTKNERKIRGLKLQPYAVSWRQEASKETGLKQSVCGKAVRNQFEPGAALRTLMTCAAREKIVRMINKAIMVRKVGVGSA